MEGIACESRRRETDDLPMVAGSARRDDGRADQEHGDAGEPDQALGARPREALRRQLRAVAERFSTPAGRHVTAMLAASDLGAERRRRFATTSCSRAAPRAGSCSRQAIRRRRAAARSRRGRRARCALWSRCFSACCSATRRSMHASPTRRSNRRFEDCRRPPGHELAEGVDDHRRLRQTRRGSVNATPLTGGNAWNPSSVTSPTPSPGRGVPRRGE